MAVDLSVQTESDLHWLAAPLFILPKSPYECVRLELVGVSHSLEPMEELKQTMRDWAATCSMILHQGLKEQVEGDSGKVLRAHVHISVTEAAHAHHH